MNHAVEKRKQDETKAMGDTGLIAGHNLKIVPRLIETFVLRVPSAPSPPPFGLQRGRRDNPLRDRLIAVAPDVNGEMILPNAPGLGTLPDFAAVKEYGIA